jgi:acyl-CoA synthetase (AMP-forming)/AMP-acid ligase II
VSTVTRWWLARVDAHGDQVALVEPDGVRVTYAQLEARVAALAGGLRARGLRRGDRLASFVPNGVVGVELLLATARLGAVTVGVNTRYRADDLRHVVERSRARLLVASDAFLDIDYRGIVADALEGLGQRTHARWPDVLWPEDVEALRVAAAFEGDDASGADLLVAFTTSGTTGKPKLAAHDHATTVRHLDAAAASLEVETESVGLLAVPFCGTFGFVSLLAMLAGGASVVVASRFEAAHAADLVERHRVTHLNASDDMILGLLAAGSDLSSWRHGVHAEFTGRGLDAVAAAEKVGARITGVYGSSETFALLARRPVTDPLAGRARNGGTFLDPDNEARAIDPLTGHVRAPGEAGELHVRGPSVLQAYLTEDGAVAPELTDGGWFATGDLGVVEPDGSFVYVARLGDALRLAGFLTDPAEIEHCLLGHPSVTGAQVVGVPGSGGGQVAVAFVTVRPGSSGASAHEPGLVGHCRARLANYKVPTRVVVVDEFPTVAGANGIKVRKTELRARAVALLGPQRS